MIRKWQTLIDTYVDVKTSDGYILRLFTISFTKRHHNQIKKTSYAQRSQIKTIRQKINELLTKEVAKVNINDLVKHLTTSTYNEPIIKACQYVYPI